MTVKITKSDRKKYILKTPRDEWILKACKKLERKKLAPQDKFLVKFIKTQLYDDWRGPLVGELKKLLQKYAK